MRVVMLFASAPSEPPTDWASLLTIVALVVALSAVMGFIGWKKRDGG